MNKMIRDKRVVTMTKGPTYMTMEDSHPYGANLKDVVDMVVGILRSMGYADVNIQKYFKKAGE